MVDVALEQNQVAVDSALAVKTPEGKWLAIWVDRQVGRGDQARPEDIQRIRNDPQLSEILKVAEPGSRGRDRPRPADGAERWPPSRKSTAGFSSGCSR